MSLASLRRWTSSRPSVVTTAMATERCGSRSGAHLGAGDGGDHAVVVVDDVDQLVAVGHGVTSCSFTASTYHSAHDDRETLRDEAHDLLATRWSRCGARCTSGRSSATTCPSPASTCSERSRACRWTSRCTRPPAASPAMLDGGKPGPTVLLRGDMDALPMPEDTGLDFASRVDDTMHACGHDTHTAMLVGAARLLRRAATTIAGRVLFMFQPGEEGHHGAQFMLDEGLLDVPTARRRHAVAGRRARSRCTSRRRCRRAASARRGGPIMASSDRCSSRSSVAAATPASRTARSTRSRSRARSSRRCRRWSPGDRRVRPAVVTVGRITAGTTNNVIPETAEIEGTIRAVSERPAAGCTTASVASPRASRAAHDADVEVEVDAGYPVTVNDDAFTEFALDVAGEMRRRRQGVRLPNPVMGAEDFSYVIEQIPGHDDVPRRHAARPQPADRGAEPLEPRRTSTRRRWSTAPRCTRRWRCATSLAAC